MADNAAHPSNRRRVLTFNDLPDNDLLAVFDFYVVRHQILVLPGPVNDYETIKDIESWQTLVHVCRRWRGLVFRYPRRLNLQLFYISGISTKKTVDVWPTLPLLINILGGVSEESVDLLLAELEQSDRISQIDLGGPTTSQFENLWTAMHVPFPELEILRLSLGSLSNLSPLPESFLGGSAPRLRFLALTSIPFPGLPKLLLSATHLVYLSLLNIPHSGYISPETMATCLSVLTSLVTLRLEFESPLSSPDQESWRPPLPTRSVLPALEEFTFKGVNEYLERLLVQLDAPRLYRLTTKFFNDIDFDTPELGQFINRTLKSRTYNEVHLIFRGCDALVRLHQVQPERLSDRGMVEARILSQVSDWQLSSLAQFCTLSLLPLLTMENLYIYEGSNSPPKWKDDVENAEWLDLLLSFTTVKNLYLSKQFSPRIAPALQELTGGRATEVLPSLQNVLLEGLQPSQPGQEGIVQFTSARKLTSNPVAISVWDRGLPAWRD